MSERETAILDELNDLLEIERAALLQGEIDKVGRVLDTKEKLLRELTACAPADTKDLDELRIKLSRNQELIENAMKGIEAVAKRFSTIRKVRKSLQTYDRSGHRKMIDITPGGRLERRA
ncbi:flagellar biosynthesis protein FlgN [Marinovum sp.]|uniref:flagellar biosynthesis protein FlgN n=1 Tax=Marinovum sp. TaxID=2024839 RepID=UPI002B26BA08|nr:flagellar biosynthesis protein FlgN [Marinovum sp.]